MDKRLLTEAKLRTIELISYRKAKKGMRELELRLIKIFSQTHYTSKGIRRKMTKQVKISRMHKAIDKHFESNPVELEQDVINQLKVIDNA